MTQLQKFEKINQCETVAELEEAIISISEDGVVHGRGKNLDAIKLAAKVNMVVKKQIPANVLTREYGIRQQALYLSHYLYPSC